MPINRRCENIVAK